MKNNLFYKFYVYQNERFPLIVLAISLLPAVLSSSVIVESAASVPKIGLTVLIAILYLLHVRLLDDRRDFLHDNKFHKDRPVQMGIISKKELISIDILIVPLLVLLALLSGPLALLLMLLLISFSYFAEQNFHIGSFLSRHFFLYNLLNTCQTIGLQIFIYFFLNSKLEINNLLFLHFLFTCLGTLVFEFARKVKRPGKDGSGKDTYTHFLGFRKSIFAYLFLCCINLSIFLAIATIIAKDSSGIVVGTILAAILILGTSIFHLKKKEAYSEKIMQLSFILSYAVCNLVIFLL